MGALFGLIGALGILVCIIMIIVSAVKKNGNIKKITKGLGISFVIFVIGIIVSPSSNTSTSELISVDSVENVEQIYPASVHEKNFNYEIFSIEDFSHVSADRYSYNIVVKKYYNTEELKQLSDEVIEQAKQDQPFNAISIKYIDYPELIPYGSVFGMVEYAPNGDWSTASEVKTGDYSTMKFNYTFKEKDWNKRPSDSDIKLFVAWNALSQELDADTDEEVTRELIKRNNIQQSYEDVDGAVMEVFAWMW